MSSRNKKASLGHVRTMTLRELAQFSTCRRVEVTVSCIRGLKCIETLLYDLNSREM